MKDRVGLLPFQSVRTEALSQFLALADERDPLMADALRQRLNLPPRKVETPTPSTTPGPVDSQSSTNSVNP